MMKNALLLAVLAVLSAYVSAAAVDSVQTTDAETRRAGDLVIGTIGSGDRVLYRNWHNMPPVPQALWGRDVIYRGSARITAIRAIEVDNNPTSIATLVEGGIGDTTATIRLVAARGFGFYFRVEVYGQWSGNCRVTGRKLKMKNLVLFAVLAVVAAVASGAVIQQGAVGRSNLQVGYVASGDRLLYRNYFYKAPYPNAVQSQDIIYRGSRSTRITAVQASEVGYTQYAHAYIISGGVGSNNVTVRLATARGYGYYYMVDIYGR
ncbi:uncharacterized protein LOC142982776 [Anticarsia gemmatalis]|uniref:uncharacterized protein LOC142982776 n=1 Tax=Anticarsia gemmatalis TaxID=129554 RepID=UPI003F772EBE